MSSKGLPGFLRRSLRRDFEEDDEEDRQQSVSKDLNQLSNSVVVVVPDPGANNDDGHNNTDNGNDSGPLDYDKNQEYHDTGAAQEEEEEDSNTEDYNHKNNSPLDRLDNNNNSAMSSLESSPDNSSNDNIDNVDNIGNGNITHKEQRPSYRETQFEKTISADVVKMTELRNLSWNGIPVRTDCMTVTNNDYILYCICYRRVLIFLFDLILYHLSRNIVAWLGKSCLATYPPTPVDDPKHWNENAPNTRIL
jgi:hypothetical protein